MTIDRYLAELSAALRIRGRAQRRILAEVRAHLEEAAESSSEADAVARFGAPAEIAQRFHAEYALDTVGATVRNAVLLVGGMLLVFAVIQGVGRARSLEFSVYYHAWQHRLPAGFTNVLVSAQPWCLLVAVTACLVAVILAIPRHGRWWWLLVPLLLGGVALAMGPDRLAFEWRQVFPFPVETWLFAAGACVVAVVYAARGPRMQVTGLAASVAVTAIAVYAGLLLILPLTGGIFFPREVPWMALQLIYDAWLLFVVLSLPRLVPVLRALALDAA